jgi:hypothetical protein
VAGGLRVASFIVIFVGTVIITVFGGAGGILIWLAAVLLVLCLTLPITFLVLALVIRSARVPARPALRQFDPGEAVLPAELAESLDKIARQTEETGFELRGHYQVEVIGAVQSYLSVFDRALSHDRLWLMNQFHRSRWRIGYRDALTLTTEFSDGQVIETTNRKPMDPFPDPPHRRTMWLPNARDTATLFDKHTRIIENLHLNHARVSPEPDPTEHFHRDFDEAFHYLLALNYVYLDAEGHYRFTWKGSLMLAYRQFFAPVQARRKTRPAAGSATPKAGC